MTNALLALILSGAQVGTAADVPGLGRCPADRPRSAKGRIVQPRTLEELPPGDLFLTVMRNVNGCPEAVVVRENYGGAGGTRSTQDPHRAVVPRLHRLPPGGAF